MFCSEFCEISKNIIFHRTPQEAASLCYSFWAYSCFLLGEYFSHVAKIFRGKIFSQWLFHPKKDFCFHNSRTRYLPIQNNTSDWNYLKVSSVVWTNFTNHRSLIRFIIPEILIQVSPILFALWLKIKRKWEDWSWPKFNQLEQVPFSSFSMVCRTKTQSTRNFSSIGRMTKSRQITTLLK